MNKIRLSFFIDSVCDRASSTTPLFSQKARRAAAAACAAVISWEDLHIGRGKSLSVWTTLTCGDFPKIPFAIVSVTSSFDHLMWFVRHVLLPLPQCFTITFRVLKDEAGSSNFWIAKGYAVPPFHCLFSATAISSIQASKKRFTPSFRVTLGLRNSGSLKFTSCFTLFLEAAFN